MTEPTTQKITSRQILVTTGAAFVVAAIVVFAFVAPAEYGFDPLRTGRLFGLTALSDAEPANSSFTERELRSDTYEVEIAPFEWFEYKYHLEDGAGMVYAWEASAPVHVEMHSHPYDAPDDFAEFYDVGDSTGRTGTYIAPFTGEHGWYWLNEGAQPLTVRLRAYGSFTRATEYAEGSEIDPPIDD